MTPKNKDHRKQQSKKPPASRPALLFTKIGPFLIIFLAPVFFGIMSVHLGQDNNWDLRNYHFYNPYAFLNDRLSFDYAPAQLQTFLNPVIDLPFYYLVTNLSPKAVGFSLGLLHGINFSLLFTLCLVVLAAYNRPVRLVLAFILTMAGVYAPIMITLLGTTTNDITSTVFVLAAILIVAQKLSRERPLRPVEWWSALGIASVLIGMGIGLKLTLAVYGIGFLLALMIIDSELKNKIINLGVASVSVMTGMFITSGIWMINMWNAFGNPLFPFYNKIFRSPYYPLRNFADIRYIPTDLIDHLVFPFAISMESHHTYLQHQYRDIRFAVVEVLLLIIVGWFFYKRFIQKSETGRTRTGPGLNKQALFLIFFVVGSYLSWQLKFAVLRYSNPLELLAPLVILLLISYLIPRQFYRMLILALTLIIIAVVMQPPEPDRIPWSSSFFRVRIPEYDDPENAIIIIDGTRPWSYLIPFFPPKSRFVRVSSNFSKPGQDTKYQTEVRKLLREHQGRKYLITRQEYALQNVKDLTLYQLKLNPRGARPILSQHEKPGLFLVPLERITTP